MRVCHYAASFVESRPASGFRRPNRNAALAVAGLGAIGLVEQLRLVWHFQTITGNDQTLLWYAGRDWGRLHPQAPHFYGQRYGGNTLETIPVEILRRVGVPMNTGLPLTLCLLGLGAWLVLAWVALRRDHPVLAVAAAAAPIVLSTYSAAFIALYGGVGRVLGVGGLALLLVWHKRLLTTTVGYVLCGFAIAFDVRSALFVAPTLVYLFLVSDDRRRLVLAAGIAAIPLAGWLLFTEAFYRTHPDYVIYGAAELNPRFGTLQTSLTHPSRFWQMFTPELLRWWAIPVGAVLVLVAALLVTRESRFVLPALLMCALLVGVLASPASSNPGSTFEPTARLLLFAPIAVWFLALFVAESALATRLFQPLRPSYLSAAVIALALLTATVRLATFNARFLAIEHRGKAVAFSNYPLYSTATIKAECRTLRSVATRERTHLVVYTADDVVTYACAALDYGRTVTLFPFFERRTWLLRHENQVQRDRMIVWGAARDFCAQVAPISTRCVITGVQPPSPAVGPRFIAAVQFPRQTTIQFLDRARVFVRPFGRHCDPTVVDWWRSTRPTQCHRQQNTPP
jgi:hypothetical protein